MRRRPVYYCLSVYFQFSSTYLPEILNISLYVEAMWTRYECTWPSTIHLKFITKCDSLFYYKVRWFVITKCDRYYKVRQNNP